MLHEPVNEHRPPVVLLVVLPDVLHLVGELEHHVPQVTVHVVLLLQALEVRQERIVVAHLVF